jgi:hypothetical protein
MKERPIIFYAPEVRAILEGKKTQTRRIMKPQPTTEVRSGCMGHWSIYPDVREFKCPFGVVSERLWVLEDWQIWTEFNKTEVADLPQEARDNINYLASCNVWDARIRPAIHMPRWASRIQLEITDVRVERLCDVTDADALDEGITHRYARDYFIHQWCAIHGKGAWDLNPYVWVVVFKRISK